MSGTGTAGCGRRRGAVPVGLRPVNGFCGDTGGIATGYVQSRPTNNRSTYQNIIISEPKRLTAAPT